MVRAGRWLLDRLEEFAKFPAEISPSCFILRILIRASFYCARISTPAIQNRDCWGPRAFGREVQALSVSSPRAHALGYDLSPLLQPKDRKCGAPSTPNCATTAQFGEPRPGDPA